MKVFAAIAALLLVAYVTGARFPSSLDEASQLSTIDAQALEQGFDLVRRANVGAIRTLKGGDDGKKGDDQKKGGDQKKEQPPKKQEQPPKKQEQPPKKEEQPKKTEQKKGDQKKGDDSKKGGDSKKGP